MSLREDAMNAQPDFPWLRGDDAGMIGQFMSERGWLGEGERIESCGPAGQGNMNLTLRIRTNRRDLVLKQARPWVERYDDIPAPWDRIRSEIRFYERVAELPGVVSRMPRILATDLECRAICMEYLEGTGDYSDLYDPEKRSSLEESDIDAAAEYLGNLHRGTLGEPDPELDNREMRALNFTHIFEVPLSEDNGLDLESLETGLSTAAARLRQDTAYRDRVAETARVYLGYGDDSAGARCLLHGDYFPGSWLRTAGGLRVIDPEFCFHGAPEIDLGCAIAHLALAAGPESAAQRLIDRYRHHAAGLELDHPRVARFAAAEIMRRLIGVAQLPLPASSGERQDFRARLLSRSRQVMLAGKLEPLWLSRAEGS